MKRSATFSDDRTKRFELIRDWRDEIGASQKTALFGLLNPSSAGEEDDDPTARKVIGFAKRWGFGRAVIVNLCPTVNTDPWKLPLWRGIDMQNRSVIEAWIALADMTVAAWGSQPLGVSRNIALPELVYDFLQIAAGRELYCIGRTKSGAPLHPSRAPYTEKPERFE